MQPAATDPPVVRSVLVVDDHAGFRASARELLEQGAYRVVGEASDGASALAAAERLQPDLMLLDVALPDIDGFEVARRLMATQPALVIVLVSSRDARDYGGRVERSGVRGFIQKARLSSSTLGALAG